MQYPRYHKGQFMNHLMSQEGILEDYWGEHIHLGYYRWADYNLPVLIENILKLFVFYDLQ